MDSVIVSRTPPCPEAMEDVRALLPLPPYETEIRYPRYQRSRNLSPVGTSKECYGEGEGEGVRGHVNVVATGAAKTLLQPGQVVFDHKTLATIL